MRFVDSEGASLAYSVAGEGPALLLIPGAGGSSGVYRQLAAALANQFSVVTYDRRCNGQSTGNPDAVFTMAQQGRDAVAVLEAAGFTSALIFGNSGGANIALQLAADHPTYVRALLLHEAPAVGLLPEDDEIRAFVAQVYEAARSQGPGAAMGLFASRMVGLFPPGASGGSPGGAEAGGALVRPESMKFFFSKEYLEITLFAPDFAALKKADVPALALVGELSRDAYYVRTCRLVAEGLGCPVVKVPGNHLAFVFEPAAFAEALSDAITRLSDRP